MRSLATYLFVSDVDASLRFYSAIGMSVEKVSDAFGRAFIEDEVVLELGSSALTRSYDPKFSSPEPVSKGTLNFEFDSAQAVDEKFQELVSNGYTGHLEPIDALWQSRFAIVLDPDGNQVGLHGPRNLDEDRQREQGGT